MDSRSGPLQTGRENDENTLREDGISLIFERRTVLLAGLGLAGACASTPWSPPVPGTFRVVEHQPIEVRDGVRLSARLWLPEGDARVPAVLECVPYRKRDLYRGADDLWGPQLAATGIAFVRLDVRGSGESDGVLTDEYSEAELADCEDVIAWLARQDWCNGAVGMRGISWGGINALQVAARQPPALRAIMPMGTCDRRYTDDAHYVGGSLAHTNFQWGALFKKVMAGPPDPLIHGERWREMWRARLEATPPMLATWLTHQREDAYWKRGSVFEAHGDVAVPAYVVSGWSDTYATPGLRMFANMRAPAKALIGPWGHTYPYTAAQGLDWAHEEVRWWRQWLMGEDTGIMDEPRLRLFMPEATASEGGPIPGRWIGEQAWPPKTSTRSLFLNAGTLETQAKAGAPLVHRDRGVVGATKPEWLDRLPIEQSHDDRLSAVFDAAPLDEAMEIAGEPELTLHVAADRPVARVVVRLCDVRDDGKSWLVTWAALNLTRRESMSEPSPLEPGRVYAVKLKLRPTAYRFRAGSRVRLSISEGFWPMLWPSPEMPSLTLPMGLSTLSLPVRATDVDAHFPIAQHGGGDPAPDYAPATPDTSGRIVLTHTQPEVAYPVAGADGIILSTSAEESSEMVAGGPLSCRWRQVTRSGWKRGDWECGVEASYELTADASSFRIVETLRATQSGREVFARESDQRIPRDLM